MAIYIPIRLVAQTAETATHEYSQPILAPDAARPGRFEQVAVNVGLAEVSKQSGDVRRLTETPWDADQSVFVRVAQKLREAQHIGNSPLVLSYSA